MPFFHFGFGDFEMFRLIFDEAFENDEWTTLVHLEYVIEEVLTNDFDFTVEELNIVEINHLENFHVDYGDYDYYDELPMLKMSALYSTPGTLLNNRESLKKIAWACDWYRLKAHIF